MARHAYTRTHARSIAIDLNLIHTVHVARTHSNVWQVLSLHSNLMDLLAIWIKWNISYRLLNEIHYEKLFELKTQEFLKEKTPIFI